MIVDALILAGGRSSRLGHSDKHRLQIGGETLLHRSVDAVRRAGARHVIVVGDEELDGVPAVREQPAFAGPVAAIAAGLRALPGDAEAVLVIACDMPGIGAALPTLLAGFAGDGAIAVDRGRRQQLAIVVRPAALGAAIDALPTVVDASMRTLLSSLDLAEASVPDGSTDDIDTWEDAARFGAAPTTTGVPAMTAPDPTTPLDADGILADWTQQVRSALGIDAEVDIRTVLGLAAIVAHASVRPAAPLTTYLVGFAAGRAAALGEDSAAAAADATRLVKELAARHS